MTWPQAKLKYVARSAYEDALPQNEEQEGTTTHHHVRWLFYVLQSLKLEQGTDEADVPRLKRDDAYTQKVFIPPRSEQQAIARYLDTETAKIDQLIQAHKQLLELLAEKHHALITHAVTRGLNPDVPMRDSGVYWIGKIPNHWQVLKLRRCIISLDQGWSPKADEPEPEEQKWGILKRNAVQGGQFDDSQAKAIPISPDLPKHLEIQSGDFLITKANTRQLVGDVCYVQKTRPNLILSDFIYRLRLDESKLNGQFLSFFLQSQMGRLQIEADARGPSTFKIKISQGHIRDWLVFVPPRDEQNRIIDYIDTQIYNINTLKAATEQTLELLNERRRSIITAVINGQIQVQE